MSGQHQVHQQPAVPDLSKAREIFQSRVRYFRKGFSKKRFEHCLMSVEVLINLINMKLAISIGIWKGVKQSFWKN